jgi:hypothetical protein
MMYLKTNWRNDAVANLEAYRERLEERQQIADALPNPMPATLDLTTIPDARVNAPPRQRMDYSERPAYRRSTEEDALMVGAPPSRAAGGVPENYVEESPSRVRLSVEEADLCRAQGLDPVTYAKGKLRLQREKKLGLRQL